MRLLADGLFVVLELLRLLADGLFVVLELLRLLAHRGFALAQLLGKAGVALVQTGDLVDRAVELGLKTAVYGRLGTQFLFLFADFLVFFLQLGVQFLDLGHIGGNFLLPLRLLLII